MVPDNPAQSLLDSSLRNFVREVGARSAAPGGGSVAAAAGAMVSVGAGSKPGVGGTKDRAPKRRTSKCGTLKGGTLRGSPSCPQEKDTCPQGAALACMAGQMTYGRRRFEHLDAAMRRLIPPFHKAADRLTLLVDADAQAFAACLVSRAWGIMGMRGQGEAVAQVPLSAQGVEEGTDHGDLRQAVAMRGPETLDPRLEEERPREDHAGSWAEVLEEESGDQPVQTRGA